MVDRQRIHSSEAEKREKCFDDSLDKEHHIESREPYKTTTRNRLSEADRRRALVFLQEENDRLKLKIEDMKREHDIGTQDMVESHVIPLSLSCITILRFIFSLYYIERTQLFLFT